MALGSELLLVQVLEQPLLGKWVVDNEGADERGALLLHWWSLARHEQLLDEVKELVDLDDDPPPRHDGLD